MSRSPRPEVPVPHASRPRRLAAIAAFAACCRPASPPRAAPATPRRRPASRPCPLTVGLGFIPNVQFAQFYLADQSGAYDKAGLDVTLQNKIDPDLIALLGQGAIDIGSGDGTSVIPAVSNGIPIAYTATSTASSRRS